MKKIHILIGGLSLIGLFLSFGAYGQKLNDMVNLKFYAKDNALLPAPKKHEKRVVFIGNSITQGWARMRPGFFSSNNYIGRGIGGQTSPQLLLRFQQDVVALRPVAVVINVGTNDIAENTGSYDPIFTFDNIKAMVAIAQANNIKVILSSVLPAAGFKWNESIKDAPQKIDALNEEIAAYAKANKLAYIDYNSELRDESGALKAHYGDDGVHPNEEAYVVMEGIAKPIVDAVVVD
ncbi:GDSL-type esterase/lipase family protein [Olivibacter sitiensis]|uniref:GDSL-type esterase/lipase family protein n=1 Tax=Olivibacter sitiensis TaxID=376470 RepID=UPI000422440F|nr:GDSL-type esterase/lipase family protein [Olivibacter sitiensis]